MARKNWSVASLVEESGLDVEQVLVALWGEGINYVDESSTRLRPEDSKRAEVAVGIAGSRRRRVSYWEYELAMSRSEISALLLETGYTLHEQARNIPKGAIKRLEHIQDLRATASSTNETQEALPAAPPFEWASVGTRRAVLCLESHEVRDIHAELEQDFLLTDDPIYPPGIRYEDLLESAVERQNAGYGGERKYTSLSATAAALLHSLVQNHPFHNGNKRTALVAMLVILDRNGVVLESNQDDLFRWMVQVAAHDLLPSGLEYDQKAERETYAISEWIQKNSRPIRRDERTVTWRTLQRILRGYGCEIRQVRGEKLEISRAVEVRRRGLFRSRKMELLATHFVSTGDGRDVPRGQLKRIRDDLKLNDENGIDSENFYSRDREPDYFIAEYSKLLRRLARV
ncbi:type II toxin-antitoxin system death-on-curing family toxin [Cryobacterium sp. 10I1]|uniref:type II toxin-antitoxin system death-on-curing family toxin n=1 Tax=unclassified Cryobacterium TaxID=2649013 RepID=UPI002AC8E97A|nr:MULTISPECIES: type II toxin-antitoxin system death-on-curing family toxin [unclassified Cryobacterium]MEB0286780.1 type II toxin-antitoxin system death-on-curing family toxin [Cryobacterium sp. 10S3]MEB0303751.1 type II toxin-antitoxin system death-on-curing family toxin [Cryobacterium sp. 10I1]WPX12670.1 type II toxin-antitoxin system death-on-curing family toxin [Cryobacterium sp. 10S3]